MVSEGLQCDGWCHAHGGSVCYGAVENVHHIDSLLLGYFGNNTREY